LHLKEEEMSQASVFAILCAAWTWSSDCVD
jgi:hypothetical protein